MKLQHSNRPFVVAGVGGGFSISSELKVLNDRKAMKRKDTKKWALEIKNEKKNFEKVNALSPVPWSLVPKDANIMTTTWAIRRRQMELFKAG